VILAKYFAYKCSNKLACTDKILLFKRFLCHHECLILAEIIIKLCEVLILGGTMSYFGRALQHFHVFSNRCAKIFILIDNFSNYLIEVINYQTLEAFKEFLLYVLALIWNI
jgi:hypothetical protein